MTILLAILRAVPIWAWALAAVIGWGALQKHRAEAAVKREETAKLEQADARATAIHGALVQQTRVVNTQNEVIHDATEQARRARTDADRAAAAERRMLERLRAAGGASTHPAAAGASAPAGETAGMHADLLGRCVSDLRRMAAIADERGIAGQACERSYDALKEQTPGAVH